MKLSLKTSHLTIEAEKLENEDVAIAINGQVPLSAFDAFMESGIAAAFTDWQQRDRRHLQEAIHLLERVVTSFSVADVRDSLSHGQRVLHADIQQWLGNR